MVYRVPTIVSATASAYLVFVGNAQAGDTVKLGEELYTFTATVTHDYDVLLGATAADSASNLLKAFTVTGTAGVTYGFGCFVNPAIDQAAGVAHTLTHDFGGGAKSVIYVQAPDFGASFNTTHVTEGTAGVRMKWLSDLVSLADTTVVFTGGTNQTFDPSITGLSKWLEFVDPDTNVMRSPVVDDKFQRYYFASPSLPPQYNTYDRIQASQSPWLLGVPAPGCNPGVSVTGGGDISQLGFPVSVSSNTNTPGSNFLFLLPITPTGAMTLNDVSFVSGQTSATAQFAAVLYSDNGSGPGDLLSTGEVVAGVTDGNTAVSPFLNPFGLLVDVKYWVGILTDTSFAVALADDVGHTGVKASTTFTNGPPLLAPSMTTGQPNWNMWVDLTTSSVLEARAYVYTWVTAYAEEGPPSPPTLANGWSNGVWTIELFTPPPDEMGVTRNITKKRLYRTVSATSGQTTYFLVAELDVNLATYIDTIDDSVVALNSQLESTLWFPPPEGLQGIVSLPNGMSASFKGNELWFSEPYRPHAWSPASVLTTEFPIVGIGVTGQSVVAATSGTPYIATGVNPRSMSLSKVLKPEPCISRGSILSSDAGVYYASTNGLILVTQYGAATNTTEGWVTREKWRTLTPAYAIRAIELSSCYFAFGSVAGSDHSVAQKGFTIELAVDNQSFTIWPQPGGHRLGFNQLAAPNAYDIVNVQVDPWTGIGLLVQNSQVYYYDFADQAPAMQPYKWRSKVFQQKTKANFGAMKVYFTVPTNTPTQASVRNEASTNDASWNTLGANQYGIVRVFADGVLVTTREIRASGELLRILSGFKAEQWQWEFEGRVVITNLQAATTAKGLGGV